jgi:acetyl esterase/lipase
VEGGILATVKILLTFLCLITPLLANDWVNLWPGDAPGAPQPPEGSETANNGHFSNIEVPQYRLFQPEKPNGQCLVVLPGGGYTVLAAGHEGLDIAKNLNAKGITAIVVKYRVAREDSFKYHFPVPLLDARRALRTARAKAAEWKIDSKRIGIIGFSAGGHLAASATTMFDERFEAETNDEIDKLSCRPDFSILGYPVILMGTKDGHGGSQRRLLGANPSEELLAKGGKVIDYISSKTPPVYFVHSANDKAVPLKNSLEFATRCTDFNVPVSGQIFAKGGHGWGATGREDATAWMKQLHLWLAER